jgi:hypothetical protein
MGYSQKASLILLPIGSTKIHTYDIQTEETDPVEARKSFNYSKEKIQITPNNSERRRSSDIKKHRLCKIIGSICRKKWSAGTIKLFSLPATSGITL